MGIDDKHIGKRVDVYLLEVLRDRGIEKFSRSMLKDNWGDFVKINDVYQKPSYKIKSNDRVDINIDNVERLEDKIIQKIEIKSQEKKLEIIYEDKNMLVMNKPKGMVIHPGLGNTENTLANFVRGYLESRNEYDPLLNRGGVVHRLDKGVSGIVVFAKNVLIQKYLQKQFEEHNVNKVYLAEVELKNISDDIENLIPSKMLDIKNELKNLESNEFEMDGSWLKVEGYVRRSSSNRLKMEFQKYQDGNSRYSLSYVKFVDNNNVLVVIKTGRMHQIRATLSYLGVYIKGDTLYSSKKENKMPDSIELDSIYLAFKGIDGGDYSFSKY